MATKKTATKKTATKKTATKKTATRKAAAKKKKTVEELRARITVSPRSEIPDPEGEAIRAALERLGFDQVSEVRAGRSFEIALAGVAADAASDLLGRMCEQLLANAVAEEYSVELLEGGGGGES